jgi:ketosteroid isomerase-like protein
MKKLSAPRKALLLVPLLAVVAARANAQSPPKTTPPDALFRTIASLDGALFDAFNRCDLEKFSSFFVDDLEFYHDYDGLTVGRQNVTEAVKKNICGKVSRELVPGTLQVYPMRGYGAIEMGTHRFHHPKAEATEPVGEGRFVHLWQNKDGAWKITRVLSYDHHALPK